MMDATHLGTDGVIAAFIECVYEPGDWVEVRYIWPVKKDEILPHSMWYKAVDLAGAEFIKVVQKYNDDRWGVYVGVNPRKDRGGKKTEDVAVFRCLFVDFDGVPLDEVRRRIDEATLPVPTMIVASGREHGYHVYWRLDEPVPCDDWKRYQQGIIDTLGSDGVIKDPPRVMRLPGFLNTKTGYDGTPSCTIVEHDPDRRYGRAEFDKIQAEPDVPATKTEGASDLSPPVAAPTLNGKSVLVIDQYTRGYLDKQTRKGTSRTNKMWQAACNLKAQGWDLKDAQAMILPCAARDGLEDEADNRRQITNAFAQERKLTKDGKGPSQATQIVSLAVETGAELFHDAVGDPYIAINLDGNSEVWLLDSRATRRWLAGLFYRDNGTAPGSSAINDAIGTLEGMAINDGMEHEVHVRVAGDDNTIYVDLANTDRQAVKITTDGWEIVSQPDPHFRRPPGMLPLPMPERGGTVDELAPFVNLKPTSSYFPQLVSWMIMAFRPTGPYPLLAMGGSQNAGKTFACEMIRNLTDPNLCPLRTPPKEPRDIAITATNSWVFGLDNLSNIPPWMSDCLARIATGMYFTTRANYTDRDEAMFHAKRPILLNGIGDTVVASDLLRRTLRIDLDEITDEDHKPEKLLRAQFQIAAPRILGALLDGVVSALQNVSSEDDDHGHSMDDFYRWAVAAEPAMPWPVGTFAKVYAGGQRDADDVAIENSTIGAFVMELAGEGAWQGTATQLQEKLRTLAGHDITKTPSKPWPRNATRLSNDLKRLVPNLRATGILVEWKRESDKQRRKIISISKENAVTTSAPIVTPPPTPDAPPGRVRETM